MHYQKLLQRAYYRFFFQQFNIKIILEENNDKINSLTEDLEGL
jgi:hypothetical protein